MSVYRGFDKTRLSNENDYFTTKQSQCLRPSTPNLCRMIAYIVFSTLNPPRPKTPNLSSRNPTPPNRVKYIPIPQTRSTMTRGPPPHSVSASRKASKGIVKTSSGHASSNSQSQEVAQPAQQAKQSKAKRPRPQPPSPIPKHPIPQHRPVLLRRWRGPVRAALVHPSEPAATIAFILRTRLLLLCLFDQSQRPHLATHHDRPAAAGAGLAVAAGSHATGRRRRVTSPVLGQTVLAVAWVGGRVCGHAEAIGVWSGGWSGFGGGRGSRYFGYGGHVTGRSARAGGLAAEVADWALGG